MITKQFCNASAATRSSEFVRVAPPAGHVLGSESAYATLGNPMVGTDITIVSRVRDAKQAAPPRGEVH